MYLAVLRAKLERAEKGKIRWENVLHETVLPISLTILPELLALILVFAYFFCGKLSKISGAFARI